MRATCLSVISLIGLNLPSALAFPTTFPWNLYLGAAKTENPILAALFWASDPYSKDWWPDPEPVTGDSDGFGGIHMHDPSIIQYNNTFYGYTTKDLMRISSAPTLNGPWTNEGAVIRKESRIGLKGRTNPWAPEVHVFNNTFYCFYSVSTRGSHASAIGVAVSSDPVHDWLDHGALFYSEAIPKHDPKPPPNAIDPTFLLDPVSGNAYLTFGSYYGGIFQTQLEPDFLSVKPKYDAVHLLGGASQPIEGSFLSYRDGWYYLWFSHGVCCSLNIRHVPAGKEYSIRLGRSRNVSGPFYDRNGTKLLDGGYYEIFGSHGETYAPGGEGVLTVIDDTNYNGDGTGWMGVSGNASGRDVLYYHYCKSLRHLLLTTANKAQSIRPEASQMKTFCSDGITSNISKAGQSWSAADFDRKTKA